VSFEDDLDLELAVSELPWVGYVRITLVFVGVCYLLIGLATVPLMWAQFALDPAMAGDPMAPWFGASTGGLMFCCGGGVGIVNFLAAAGLKRGRKWAWLTSVVLGGIYAPSICLPFGAVMLYGMLREDVRTVFLERRRP